MPPVIYTIDINNKFSSTSSGWADFAELNDGMFLIDVVGKSLWDFIRDPGSELLYKALLQEVRYSDHNSLSFPFRCDGPTEKRWMRMIIELGDLGDVSLPQKSGPTL